MLKNKLTLCFILAALRVSYVSCLLCDTSVQVSQNTDTDPYGKEIIQNLIHFVHDNLTNGMRGYCESCPSTNTFCITVRLKGNIEIYNSAHSHNEYRGHPRPSPYQRTQVNELTYRSCDYGLLLYSGGYWHSWVCRRTTHTQRMHRPHVPCGPDYHYSHPPHARPAEPETQPYKPPYGPHGPPEKPVYEPPYVDAAQEQKPLYNPNPFGQDPRKHNVPLHQLYRLGFAPQSKDTYGQNLNENRRQQDQAYPGAPNVESSGDRARFRMARAAYPSADEFQHRCEPALFGGSVQPCSMCREWSSMHYVRFGVRRPHSPGVRQTAQEPAFEITLLDGTVSIECCNSARCNSAHYDIRQPQFGTCERNHPFPFQAHRHRSVRYGGPVYGRQDGDNSEQNGPQEPQYQQQEWRDPPDPSKYASEFYSNKKK